MLALSSIINKNQAAPENAISNLASKTNCKRGNLSKFPYTNCRFTIPLQSVKTAPYLPLGDHLTGLFPLHTLGLLGSCYRPLLAFFCLFMDSLHNQSSCPFTIDHLVSLTWLDDAIQYTPL
jgi:hypothetical protein